MASLSQARKSSCRSSIATGWPLAAKAWQMPSPMPEAPPVTTTTRFSFICFPPGLVLARRQLELEFFQPANDEARLIFEMALPFRPVHRLVITDMRGMLEEFLEHDARLDAGERVADADMGAAAEGEILLDARAVEHEFLGVLP